MQVDTSSLTNLSNIEVAQVLDRITIDPTTLKALETLRQQHPSQHSLNSSINPETWLGVNWRKLGEETTCNPFHFMKFISTPFKITIALVQCAKHLTQIALNPTFESMAAVVPGVIPLLLCLLKAEKSMKGLLINHFIFLIQDKIASGEWLDLEEISSVPEEYLEAIQRKIASGDLKAMQLPMQKRLALFRSLIYQPEHRQLYQNSTQELIICLEKIKFYLTYQIPKKTMESIYSCIPILKPKDFNDHQQKIMNSLIENRLINPDFSSIDFNTLTGNEILSEVVKKEGVPATPQLWGKHKFLGESYAEMCSPLFDDQDLMELCYLEVESLCDQISKEVKGKMIPLFHKILKDHRTEIPSTNHVEKVFFSHSLEEFAKQGILELPSAQDIAKMLESRR